jgi:hypothetical protein
LATPAIHSVSFGITIQPPLPPPPTSVTVTPATATLSIGETQQFTAVVSPPGADQRVTWSVIAGTGTGTITTAGLFTASTAGTVAVRATSVVVTTVSGEAAVTVTVPPPTPTPPDRFFSCFIATAAFETPMTEEVLVLSRFRDEYLLTNELGRRFVSLYYRHSPALSEYISDREWAKRIVRIVLSPLVRIAEFIVGGEESRE